MAQKSVIAIVQQTSAELNQAQPQAVLSSTDGNVLKILSFVRAINDDLLVEQDWNFLQQRYTFTTTDGVDNYAFPTDYSRGISGTFFDTTNRWTMKGPMSPTQWEMIKTLQVSVAPFTRFRIYNGRIYLDPVPGPTPFTFVFDYISNNYVLDGGMSGLTKPDFTQDSDVSLFDHRLVIYGAKLKWKADLGLDTTDALVEYQRTLMFAKGNDMPAPRLTMVPQERNYLSTANFPDGNFG